MAGNQDGFLSDIDLSALAQLWSMLNPEARLQQEMGQDAPNVRGGLGVVEDAATGPVAGVQGLRSLLKLFLGMGRNAPRTVRPIGHVDPASVAGRYRTAARETGVWPNRLRDRNFRRRDFYGEHSTGRPGRTGEEAAEKAEQARAILARELRPQSLSLEHFRTYPPGKRRP
jgi:hypothetical protein